VYTDITPPCIRRARDVYTAVTRPCTGCPRPCRRPLCGRVRAVHTTRIRPRTRVYVYKGRVHGRVRAIYTAENGRLHGRVTCRAYDRVRAVSPRVDGSVRAFCTAIFGRVHWPCTLPISAVYIARTRPCNGPCTRPLHGRVQGSSGPCIRQVGLPIGPCTRSQTSRYGRVQPVTAYGTYTRPCTRPV